jgi:hypothetical protein
VRGWAGVDAWEGNGEAKTDLTYSDVDCINRTARRSDPIRVHNLGLNRLSKAVQEGRRDAQDDD